MRIALFSLRVHHRAQRLFTIPLRGSVVNTEQLSRSGDPKFRRAIIARLALVSAPIDRCCRAICPYCTVGSFGRHFLLIVMWHGFDQSHFEYILRCYIKHYIYVCFKSKRDSYRPTLQEYVMLDSVLHNWNLIMRNGFSIFSLSLMISQLYHISFRII